MKTKATAKTKAPSKKKPQAKKSKTPRKLSAEPAKSQVDPDRAEAAADVLQAVWLHEKHFELENEVVRRDGRPVIREDAEGHLWVTVELHVPALDIDYWLDGTHNHHPNNHEDEPEVRL